ncbi:MAG: hypothetical protein GY730_08995 [bacterium]|nr:hypothetical protein [bacterium]
MDGTVYGIAVATLLSVVVLYLLVLIFLKKYFSIGNINAIIYFVSFISSLIFIFSVNYLVVHSFDNILWECLKISFYNFVLYFTFGAVFFLIAIKVRKNTELGLIVKK